MQYTIHEYDPKEHECRKALTVRQPYADYIALGQKKIEVRSKPTKHRGELIICSSAKPEIEGRESGVMIAAVQLYDVKPLEELTPAEWESTCIPVNQRKDYKGYGWFLKDPIRLIEYPVTGQLGIWNLIREKMEFMPYQAYATLAQAERIEKVKHYDSKSTALGLFIILTIFAVGAFFIFLIVWALFFRDN